MHTGEPKGVVTIWTNIVAPGVTTPIGTSNCLAIYAAMMGLSPAAYYSGHLDYELEFKLKYSLRNAKPEALAALPDADKYDTHVIFSVPTMPEPMDQLAKMWYAASNGRFLFQTVPSHLTF